MQSLGHPSTPIPCPVDRDDIVPLIGKQSRKDTTLTNLI